MREHDRELLAHYAKEPAPPPTKRARKAKP